MKNELDVAVIGAGFAGIAAGIKLKQQGDLDFIIFEQATEVGGTWRDNTYPGCACDIPSHLYSYSFEPNPNWSRAFSPHHEIKTYLKHCVDKYLIRPHILFDSKVVKVEFDQETYFWNIHIKDGQTYKSRVVISASGPLNNPLYPNIKGINSFNGTSFHSLFWDHDYDFTNKKVAVIGTGASAIQFIPEIAKKVKTLSVYQRTAPWIEKKFDHENSDQTKRKFQNFPLLQKLNRELIYWYLEKRGKAQYADNKIRAQRKKRALEYLESEISDPDLRSKLTPNYEIGCKRVLLSSNYYPTLKLDHVSLHTDGIDEIKSEGILDLTGNFQEYDAIIFGTGFYTTTYKHLYEVKGLNGISLFEKWNSEGGEAYYGMSVNGFPNFLMMVGPNTGLGHNSIIHMMESQLNYILDYLKQLNKNPHSFLNVKKEVQDSFNENIQAQLEGMIWSSGGCNSYYLKDNNGKNTSIWPGSTWSYRKQTKKIRTSDYELVFQSSKSK